jgi:hypothetical protein
MENLVNSAFAKAFLSAKRDMDHSISKAIKVAATRFYEQTGLVPATIEFHSAFDCHEGDHLLYVIRAVKVDFDLDEVC